MKREQLKFRGWENIMKVMCEITKIDHPNHGVQLRGMANGTNFKYVELMQFTGLKDKNGKDIYEGDIIRSFSSDGAEIKHLVKWINNRAQFCAEWLNGEENELLKNIGDLRQSWIDEFKKEVIGNLYENPELLK